MKKLIHILTIFFLLNSAVWAEFYFEEGTDTKNFKHKGSKVPKNGSGHFKQKIKYKEITVVGHIPKNIKNLEVNLTSNNDIDIQLYGEDGTAIVKWPDGLLNGVNKQNITYHGMSIEWSGYDGVDGQKGHEYIKITGKTTEKLTMKVYGYQAGNASVDYKWGDNISLEIMMQYPNRSFSDQSNSFKLLYGKSGEVRVTDCPSEVIPSTILANVETSFSFNTVGKVGTYNECNITVIDEQKEVSSPVTLREFTIFNVLGSTKLRGRDDGKGLDYVIIAEGFKKDEMSLFRAKAQEYADYILDYDSNLSLERNAWNIFTIETVSKESGADNIDNANGPKVDTSMDSYFYCNGINRLLCIDGSKATYVVSRYVPQYDKVLVLVNSDKYGGAGGNYATASLGAGGNVVVHELGHSLAGLADEYEYGGTNPPSSEPTQANITINNDLSTVKWKHWVGEPLANNETVGLYEGGEYVSKGVWRPTNNSIMRVLGKPFYYVNAEQWALSVYHAAGVIYDKTPKEVEVLQAKGSNTTFTIEPSMGSSAQMIIWQVDDINQTIANDQFSFTFGADKNVNYRVNAIISDKTGVIRKDIQAYSNKIITWNVTIN